MRMTKPRLTYLPLSGLIFACLLLSALPTRLEAARPDGLDQVNSTTDGTPNTRKSGASILQVQKALSEMGFYLGDINGHLNPETEAAIRSYQQLIGQPTDGRVTPQLWELLSNATQVRTLLKRLDTARKSGKDKATAALLAHEATRDLIRDSKVERANPTRNADACFADPTVRCLLAESRETVKAVFKPELRDWALGEILVAQARAGLTDAAMETAGKIRDPRLIVVALRDIAEALASGGDTSEALEAVKIIPEPKKRAEALLKIAQIHARQKNLVGMRTAAGALLSMMPALSSEAEQIPFKMQMVSILQQAQSPIRSKRLLWETERQIRAFEDKTQLSIGLRHYATTLAEMGQIELAQDFLPEITQKGDKETVFVALAKAMADANEIPQALEIVKKIAPRYRVTVLNHIALRQVESDKLDQSLEMARAAIEEIKRPYALSFARSRLALTLLQIATRRQNTFPAEAPKETKYFAQAEELAAQIKDNRLRAYTYWSAVHQHAEAGDHEGTAKMQTLAAKTTNEIKSKLSQVWMYADLATQNARRENHDLSWDAFNKALEIGRLIDNSWGRARSLAKLAQTLIELVTPAEGLGDLPSDQQEVQ